MQQRSKFRTNSKAIGDASHKLWNAQGTPHPALPLFFVSVLIVVGANSFAPAKQAMYAILFLAIAVPFFRRNAVWSRIAVTVISLGFIAYSLVSIVRDPSSNTAIYNGVLAAACMALAWGFATVRVAGHNLRRFVISMSRMGRGLILLGLLYELATPDIEWDSKTGMLMMLGFFILIDARISWRQKSAFLALWGFQAYMADDRAYVLTLGVGLAGFAIWPVISRDFMARTLGLATFLGALVYVPVVYSRLGASEYRGRLDQLAVDYTGSRFFSGRDVIWSEIFNRVEGTLLLGGGHNLAPVILASNEVSAHNTYVALLARLGIVGVMLFLSFLFVLLINYARHSSDFVVRTAAAFTIAILFKQSTELSLIANNIALAILSWLVMLFGLIYLNSVHDRKDSEGTLPPRLRESSSN